MAGQTLVVAFVTCVLGLALPLAPVAMCIAFTAFSNGLLQLVPPGRGEGPASLAGILAADVVLLTALLHFTGGPHNPFSSFYLVHVALAAVALPLWGTGWIAGLCCAGFGLLFFGRQVLPIPGDAVCGVGPNLPLSTHLQGMLVALVLTSGCIVVFVSKLQSALRVRERELVAARERAREQEQFAALATLAAGAAHELATPLGTIALAAGEMVRSLAQTQGQTELSEDAQLIREEVARCRRILDRLQDQSGDAPRWIHVEELEQQISSRFPERLQLRRTGSVTRLWAPHGALMQALESLVKNAFDASTPEGTVRLCIDARADRVQFEILDQGSGLTAEARKHAGEPFFTTKPAGKGTGLGLFLVRLLAMRFGGTFLLESSPGGGSCARLELPQELQPA